MGGAGFGTFLVWMFWLLPIVGALILAFAKPPEAIDWVNSTSAAWERRYEAARRGGIFRRVWRALLWSLHKLHNVTAGIEEDGYRAAARLLAFVYATGLAIFVFVTMIYIALMLVMLAIGLWIVGLVLGVTDGPSPRHIARSHDSRSRQRKDWFGDEYTEHLDADGNRTGTSRSRKGWMGGTYTERTNADGDVESTSRTRTDWMGDAYTEHTDTDGNRTGASHDRKDWLGEDYTEHSDADGRTTGTSRNRKDWMGDDYTEHTPKE